MRPAAGVVGVGADGAGGALGSVAVEGRLGALGGREGVVDDTGTEALLAGGASR